MTGATAFSEQNYSALLIAWNTNRVNYRNDLTPTFAASYLEGAAEEAREELETYGWTITDGGISYLLDLVPNAAAAYSLRRLNSAYSGPVVTVRRSSGGEEDFTASEVADGTLAAFCGSGDGFVTQWYDQSGNLRHFSNAVPAGQPAVVSSGQVVTRDDNPTLRFDGIDDRLDNSAQSNSAYTDGTGAAMFCVFALHGSKSQYSLFQNAAAVTSHRDQYNGKSYNASFRSNRFAGVESALPETLSSLSVYSQLVNVSNNSHTLRRDFVDSYSATQELSLWAAQTNVNYSIGVGGTADYAVADIPELIIYGRALTSPEVELIEGNIAWSYT
jgi:hypothetical protein